MVRSGLPGAVAGVAHISQWTSYWSRYRVSFLAGMSVSWSDNILLYSFILIYSIKLEKLYSIEVRPTAWLNREQHKYYEDGRNCCWWWHTYQAVTEYVFPVPPTCPGRTYFV